MNIRSLRKNYHQLSKRERLILYDAAENRDDKAEMDAIMLATPNVDWIKPDWALQAEQLLKMRLLNLIQRLKYSRDATLWLYISTENELTDEYKAQFFYDMARMSAYFYCVSVDSSKSVYEEMGLDVAAWKNKESELFDLQYDDEIMDSLMRSLAFDEAGAEAFIKSTVKGKGFENIVLAFTFEKKRDGFRKVLNENVFKEFFKD
jgi:hypothetical protein